MTSCCKFTLLYSTVLQSQLYLRLTRMHTGPKSDGAAHPEWETLSSTRHDRRPCGTPALGGFSAPSPHTATAELVAQKQTLKAIQGFPWLKNRLSKLPPSNNEHRIGIGRTRGSKDFVGRGIGCLEARLTLPEAPSTEQGGGFRVSQTVKEATVLKLGKTRGPPFLTIGCLWCLQVSPVPLPANGNLSMEL